jgi:hypothetical protein
MTLVGATVGLNVDGVCIGSVDLDEKRRDVKSEMDC